MEQQQTIPQDMLQWMQSKGISQYGKYYYNSGRACIAESFAELEQLFAKSKTVAHTPVSRLTQEEVEKILATLATSYGYGKPDTPDFDSHQTEEYDNNIFMKGCRAGYNAAIQSQQKSGSWSDKDMIDFMQTYSQRGLHNCTQLLEYYKRDNHGADIQSQSVQPTGSVGEIAEREYAKLNREEADKVSDSKAHDFWMAAYDSAAKNLPVVCSTGWTDTQIFEIILQGIGKTDSYPDTYEESWWADKIREWLAEYKLSHAVQVDSRIKASK